MKNLRTQIYNDVLDRTNRQMFEVTAVHVRLNVGVIVRGVIFSDFFAPVKNQVLYGG